MPLCLADRFRRSLPVYRLGELVRASATAADLTKLLPTSAAAIQPCGCSLVPLQIYFEDSWAKALLDIAKGTT